jgi:hypothetical protein
VNETRAAAQEQYTFAYSNPYLVIKVTLAIAAGVFILYTVLSSRSGTLPRLLAATVGLWFFGLALGVMKGPRRIVIDDRSIHVELGGGRRQSWALRDLDLQNAKHEIGLGGSMIFRARQGGRLAFRLPRDFPGWRRVLALIERGAARPDE